MSNSDIEIDVFSMASIKRAIKATRDYKKWLDNRTQVFIERLQQVGIEAALMYYEKASYAGEPDVLVDLPAPVKKKSGGYTARVRATGDTVLFIEFGTGIRYENPHQLAYGFFPGSYGPKGLQPWGWFYTGTPGRYAPPGTEQAKGHPNSVHTYGNPANMPMYQTRDHILTLFASIAEEVFAK